MHLVKKEERRKGDLKIGRPPQPVREVGSTLPETLPDFPVTRLAVTFLYMPHRDDAYPVIHCLERHTVPSTLREYNVRPLHVANPSATKSCGRPVKTLLNLLEWH